MCLFEVRLFFEVSFSTRILIRTTGMPQTPTKATIEQDPLGGASNAEWT